MGVAWKDVLQEYRTDIMNSADPHNVVLNRLLDHLLATRCLNEDHKEVIESRILSRQRIGNLLDFVTSEKAFDELCHAIDKCNTGDSAQLADKLRQALACRKQQQKLRVESEVQQLREERNIARDQLIKVSADYEERMKHLTDELDALKRGAVQQSTNVLACLGAPEKVKLIHAITERKRIFGIATFNNELYVYRDGCVDIAVYDTKAYSFQRNLRVPRLGLVSDMTSCARHQCMYIGDWSSNVVHRVDICSMMTRWSVDDEPHGMSVNSASNVLVTFREIGAIKEFTTEGELLRFIDLESSILHPYHAVEIDATAKQTAKTYEKKASSETLVVCHGNGDDSLQRVCLVDSSGRIQQSYGGTKGSSGGQLDGPIRILVNDNIFVADLNNHRVLMFSPTLRLIREVFRVTSYPHRMCFDETGGRMYLVDNNFQSGVVEVYGV